MSKVLLLSIVEAMSYEILVMATYDGGIGEIVNGDNGILISPNSSSQEIASFIIDLLNQQPQLSHGALKAWKENYSAEKNYKEFVKRLKA